MKEYRAAERRDSAARPARRVVERGSGAEWPRGSAVALCLRSLVCAGAITLFLPVALAEDLEKKWYFGGSLGFHTTQDEISSNAAMAFDPRPDDFISREVAVEDTIRFDLTAGFGLSKWLSLQLDT